MRMNPLHGSMMPGLNLHWLPLQVHYLCDFTVKHTLRVLIFFGDLYAEMVQGRLFLVHTVMFASTKFCGFGPIRQNIKR